MKSREHSEFGNSSNSGKDPQRYRLWIGLILFISGWMFFLGVIVGRGSIPALYNIKKIETELAELAKSASNKILAKNMTEKNIANDPPDGDFHKKLKEKTDAVPKMELSSLTQETKKPETVKPAEPSKPAEPVRSVEQSMATSQEPPPRLQTTPPAVKPVSQAAAVKPESTEQSSETIKPEVAETKIKSLYELKALQNKEPSPQRTVSLPTPATDNKTGPGQQVSIQLTGLLDMKSADLMIENLRSKGIAASKSARMIPEKGIWYRIVIERIPGSSEADAIMSRLKQDNIDASVVKR